MGARVSGQSPQGEQHPLKGLRHDRVTQLLRHCDAKVFKKHSQSKLQMKREALAKIKRLNEFWHRRGRVTGFGTVGV